MNEQETAVMAQVMELLDKAVENLDRIKTYVNEIKTLVRFVSLGSVNPTVKLAMRDINRHIGNIEEML